MSISISRSVVLALMLIGAPFATRAAAQTAGASGEAEVVTAPVELDGIVLFHVRGVTSYPAETRARMIRDRIIAVAADPSIPIEALRIVDRQGTSVIVAADRPLVPVLEADASLEQISAPELAAAYLIRLRQAILEYREARSPAALRRAAISTATAVLVFAAAILALVWSWRRLGAFLQRRLQARIHTVGIQSFEVVRADRIWAVVGNAISGVRSLLLFALSLVFIGYVLGRWPSTRGFARDLKGFVFGPLEVIAAGLLANIPSLVFLLVLFAVVRLLLRLVRLFFEAVERGAVTLSGFDSDWAAPTYKIVRVVVIAFGLIVAYPYIPGSESAAFKGVSLFIGVMFSLGSSTAISNIVAGYMMTYRRAFKVGDRVKIGDSIGDVIQMRLQVTHLRSFKNEEIVIPNSQILGGEVLNYSSLAKTHGGLILHTEVGIGYETPWRKVEAMLLAAAGRTPNLVAQPEPFVLVKRLGDFAVTYELNAYCPEPRLMNPTYTLMHHNVLDVFNEYGVQIMTPAYEGDPAEPKIVPPQSWFEAPATPSGVAPAPSESVSAIAP
jgi:small-conductance mechanosensitive channel